MDVERSPHTGDAQGEAPVNAGQELPTPDKAEQKAIETLQTKNKIEAETASLTEQIGQKEIKPVDGNLENLPKSSIEGVAGHINKVINKKLAKSDTTESINLPKDIPIKEKVELNFAFFCDVDHEDHNAVFIENIQNALDHKIPFICSKSILLGSKAYMKGVNEEIYDQMETALKNSYKDWNVFQQKTATGEGFLVFLPKNKEKQLSDSEILREVDLNSDGSLRRVGLNDILRPPNNNLDIETFSGLFSNESTKSKFFYLGGHGEVGGPGGMKSKNFNKFLTIVKKQNCAGLTIDSCYAGGASSLLNLTDQSLKFPVIIRSIGDAPTQGGQKAEKNLSGYFNELNKLLATPGGDTGVMLGKMLHTLEKGGDVKTVTNQVQVHFPVQGDSPLGFQTVGEGKNNYGLTFVKMRAEELIMKKTETNGIKIKDKENLEIHLIVIEAPLIFEGKNPILLSLIPGSAHHFIKEIHLAKDSPEEFIEKTHSFYKDFRSGVEKGFFIGKLVSDEGTREGLAILVNNKGATCIYHEGGKAFLQEGDGLPKEVSELQYACLLSQIIQKTTANTQGIRTQTGGQQSEQNFTNELQQLPEGQLGKFYKKYPEIFGTDLQKLSLEQFIKISTPDLAHLTQEDKENLVFHFLTNNRSDIAHYFFNKENLSPNATDIQGKSLIFHAVSSGSDEFAKMLLLNPQLQVNVNDPITGNTPLHIACQTGKSEIIDLLMNRKDIDVNALNKEQMPPYFANGISVDTLKLFIEKGAHKNYVNTANMSVVSGAYERFSAEEANKYISAGFDINVGDPSPLEIVVRKNNSDQVSHLLKSGADPKDVVISAILSSSEKIVAELMKQPQFDPNIENQEGVNPLLAAIRTLNSNLIQNLIETGATVHNKLSRHGRGKAELGIKRIVENNELDMLKPLLTVNSSDLRDIIVNGCLKEPTVEILRFLLEKNVPIYLFFDAIAKSGDSNLLKNSIDKIVNLNPKEILNIYSGVINSGNVEILQLLIKNHVPFPSKENSKLLNLGYKSGSKGLLMELLNIGCKFEPGKEEKTLISNIIKNNDIDTLLRLDHDVLDRNKKQIIFSASLQDDFTIFEKLENRGVPTSAL